MLPFLRIRPASAADRSAARRGVRPPRLLAATIGAGLAWSPLVAQAPAGPTPPTPAAPPPAADSARTVAAVQVTATLRAVRAVEAPQPIAVLGGADLRRAQGAAVGDLLTALPGVRSLSMSTGIGKPVIRGLTHNRVVTLDNGHRTETQQWGHDHSPNVETANAEQLEVIRGPASVLYGSDALGGVVNVIAAPLPTARGESPFVRTRLVSAYDANLRGGDATVRLEGAREGLGARLALTGRRSGDMRAPSGALPNTRNRTGHVDGALGHAGANGRVSLRHSAREERIEIFDDPATNPGYDGYQRLSTARTSLDAERALGAGWRAQAQLGDESNFRREYADAGATDIALGLQVRTRTAQLLLHHDAAGWWSGGTVGVSGMDSRFRKRGVTSLIPDSRSRGLALFALEHVERGRVRATVGARWDLRSLAIDDDAVLGLVRQRQSRQAVTGSAGVSYRLADGVVAVVSAGRGFRAPAAPDLFARGFHEGTRAYERGDPDLRVETSLNTDLALRVERAALRGELGVFDNRIADYIYLRPFGTGSGAYDSLEVVQGDARLRGAEVSLAWRATPALTLQGAGDVVRGTNTAIGVPLTFVPPPRVLLGARLERRATMGGRGPVLLSRPWVGVRGEHHWRQSHADPRDIAPPGYTLVHADAGGTLLVGPRVWIVDLALRNAMHTRHRDFMSRYKGFADGPGRTLVVRLTTDL